MSKLEELIKEYCPDGVEFNLELRIKNAELRIGYKFFSE